MINEMDINLLPGEYYKYQVKYIQNSIYNGYLFFMFSRDLYSIIKQKN